MTSALSTAEAGAINRFLKQKLFQEGILS